MPDGEYSIVKSPLSQAVLIDGCRFEILIVRPIAKTRWYLEVIDCAGTGHAWNELFGSDRDALEAALRALEAEGAAGFMRGEREIH